MLLETLIGPALIALVMGLFLLSALAKIAGLSKKVPSAWLCVGFLVFGGLMFASQIQRWDRWQGLDEGGVITTSIGGHNLASIGCWYSIVVDGQRYMCPGTTKLPTKPSVQIIYDPSQPRRCREASHANKMSHNEIMSLVFSFFFAFVGLYMFIALLRGKVRYK